MTKNSDTRDWRGVKKKNKNFHFMLTDTTVTLVETDFDVERTTERWNSDVARRSDRNMISSNAWGEMAALH